MIAVPDFANVARDELGFLEGEGFAAHDRPYGVAFVSAGLEICATFDERAFEMSAELSPKTGDYAGKRFPFEFVLAAVLPDDALTYRDYAATTATGIRNGLHILAGLIERCLPHLKDASVFVEVDRIQEAEMHAYWSDQNRRAAQSLLSDAWDRRDYAAVIRECAKLGDAMTISDRRRLFLAQRALQS